MPDKASVLTLDKPHFQVKLEHDVLKVDLKEGARREIERLAEANTALRDTLGWVFQTIVPLDIRLEQIDKVDAEPSGRVNIKVPLRRDIHIPLEPHEATKLVEKLNELIPIEKQRAFERMKAADAAIKEEERRAVKDYSYIRRGP